MITLISIAFCSYFLAKIVNAVIRNQLTLERKFDLSSAQTAPPIVKTPTTFEAYQVIADRNIFDSRDAEVAGTPVETETANLEGPAVKTTLPIKLLSTFSVGDGTDPRSSASSQSSATGSAAAADVYTIGDEKQFAPGVKVTKILPDRVEFINGNRLEYVEIEQFGAGGLSTSVPFSQLEGGGGAPPPSKPPVGVSKKAENKFVVDQAEIDSALANLDRLFTEVRAVPNFVGGKPSGLKLLYMTPTSLFAKLGLQRGDVIERINGVEIDIKRGLEIFNQLKGEKKITIDLYTSPVSKAFVKNSVAVLL